MKRKTKRRLNVTSTYLPELSKLIDRLKIPWQDEWITNRGKLVVELEEKIKTAYDLNHILLTANGTLPLHIAIRVLGLKGEVITTPFSYIATSSSLVWEGCTPVFADIDPKFLTIDPSRVKELINERTTGILATHIYGNVCDVDALEKIAIENEIQLIYDGAHSFGTSFNGNSVFNYGDISSSSFHATKVFHTGEGGALFCNRPELVNRCFQLHNFGHASPDTFFEVGTNAKMSELQAALGLMVFDEFDYVIQRRKEVVEYYWSKLNWDKLEGINLRDGLKWNYSYFPVVFESEETLLLAFEILNRNGIFPRRYFYPSLNNLEIFSKSHTLCPISEDISKRIACLPLSSNMSISQAKEVVDLLNGLL